MNALQGDQVQFVGGLTAELVDTIKADSKLKVITGPSSAFHYVIHMRSDSGHPAADVKIRKRCSSAPTTRGSSTRFGPDWPSWVTARRSALPTVTITWTRRRSTT